jgi:hypothetical protein
VKQQVIGENNEVASKCNAPSAVSICQLPPRASHLQSQCQWSINATEEVTEAFVIIFISPTTEVPVSAYVSPVLLVAGLFAFSVVENANHFCLRSTEDHSELVDYLHYERPFNEVD